MSFTSADPLERGTTWLVAAAGDALAAAERSGLAGYHGVGDRKAAVQAARDLHLL